MIACPRCGTANPDQAKFCAECAAPLQASSPWQRHETRKTVTILFADVAGSTELSERLDAEAVRARMAGYFAIARRVIETHGGTVEKFIGDAVMAVFGVPVVHEDDALRAVRAAIELRDAMAEHGTLRIRVGVNTGEVVAGDPSDRQTFVTGDAVNTAARLEAAARPGDILIGRATWGLVRDAVTAEPMDPIVAKGKTQPVEAYRLVGVDRSRAGHERRLDRPMIGRTLELALLRDAFEAVVRDRTCRLVTLLGTAGVGKSRLVSEFVESSAPAAPAAPAATVLRGRCLSYGEGVTYWPIAEIIRSAAGVLETETPAGARAKILALIGESDDAEVVAGRVAIAIGLSTDVAPQEELFWAIRRLLEQMAHDRPLIVVIEDIHWAEPTLLDLIEHLAEWSRAAPILLLCPARPELLDAQPRWGDTERDDLTITLEPLGASATRDLIAGLPGGSALPPAVMARLTSAAEGNPLFVEEFLGMLVDDGLLIASANGTWSAAPSVDAVRMPPSVKALISARLERLAPEERAVAERASVVGRVFEQAAVTELSSDALRPEVERNLLALVRKELVRRETTELSVGDAFKFHHVLIRDAAYEALPKSERAILHERFADWLDRTVGDRLPEYEEIVGYHLEQAHRYRTELGETGDAVVALASRAGAHLSAAGVAAAARGDLPSGIALFTRAAALIPAGRQRIELLINLRSTLRAAGEREAADAADAEAVALLDAYPDEGLRHHYRLTNAKVELETTSDDAEQAFDYYERIGDASGMIRALQLMSWDHGMKGRFTKAVEIMDRAAALATDLGRPDLVTSLLSSSAPSIVDSPMPVPEALERCTTYLDLVGDDRQGRVMLLLAIGGLEAMTGVHDTWRRSFEAAKAIIDDLDLVVPFGAALYPLNLADAELLAGDPARVVDLLRQSCATLERLALPYLLASLAPVAAQTLLALGQLDEVEHFATLGRDVAASDDIDAQARWRNAMSGLRSIQGVHDEAITLAEESVAVMAGTELVDSRATGHMVLARAFRAAGEESRAVAAALAAKELAVAKGNRTAIRTINAFFAAGDRSKIS